MFNQNLLDLTDSREFPILDEKYILIKKIGSGATCKVKLAKHKDSEEILAVKILNNSGGRSITANKHHIQEIEMLKKVSHPNIINLRDGNRGIIKKPDGRSKMVEYIVLEYAGNGELFDYIYFPREGLGEKLSRGIFKQLIEGLEGCHSSGVVHRDLKTENLMLNLDWVLKIADFGYATLLAGKSGNGLLTTFLGTLSYAAPEILNKKPYVGSCADIFSCGVILFVLVTGKLPFGKAVVFDSYYKNFIRNDYESFWSIMSPKIGQVSDEFKSLINLLLAYDSTQRPTITEIKQHPWMNKELPTYEEYRTEFEKRKLTVLKMKELEAIEEAKKKKRGGAGGVYRGDNDDNCEIMFEGERRVEDWVDGENMNMFSPYKIKMNGGDYLQHLNFLVNYFKSEDKRVKEINVHDELAKFKVTYDIEMELVEQLPEIEIEKLSFSVDLRRIDEENYVAEFTKLGGDKLEFFNVYDEFVTYTEKNQK
jgi:serine/threonine protein kinase